MLSKDDWIMTIDISDVYLTIPLYEEFKDYVASVSGSDVPISVLSFRSKQCRKGLDKGHKVSCGQSKSSWLQGSSICRRLDSCCPNKAFSLKQSQFLVHFLQKLGLRINLKKSSLTPFQVKEWGRVFSTPVLFFACNFFVLESISPKLNNFS